MVEDGIEFVRYAFDEDGPHINIGRIRTFTGSPVPYVPSALSKIGTFFLGPFLAATERVGWDRAVEDRKSDHIKYFETFRLNDRPIMMELGQRLRLIKLRLISEDRE